MPTDREQIDTYLGHLAQLGRSPDTIRSYRQALHRAAACLTHGLCSDGPEITAWLATLRARNTRASYAVALRGLYRWAVVTGRLEYDPMADQPVPPRRRGLPRPVTHEELAALLTQARQPDRVWCTLAAFAGLRCVEIARLERDDVTPELVYVRGKGDRDRAVPTHPEVLRAVTALPAGPVAGGRTAKCLSTRIARECDRLGLPAVTAHRLRHWAGTWWQAATGDVRVTQELLGHANPATTAVYTLASDAAKRAAVLGVPVSAATAAGGG